MYFLSPDKNMEDIIDVINFTYTNLTWFIFKLLYIKNHASITFRIHKGFLNNDTQFVYREKCLKDISIN